MLDFDLPWLGCRRKVPTCGMRFLLIVLLAGGWLMAAASAFACEKHLDGHQSGANTQSEVQGR